MRLLTPLIVFGSAVFLYAESAQPCSSFTLPRSSYGVIGKSYDWYLGHGEILQNKKGILKKTLRLKSTDVETQWISQYGSLTFNQHGYGFPLGGMNQAGLVVEILWLDKTKYPDPDRRPSFNELQWIQYQLDRFSSVEEVVRNAPKIRVDGIAAPVHYFVCDQSNRCATIEYLRKKLVIHTGKNLKYPALTNHPYRNSLSWLGVYRFFRISQWLPSSLGSRRRFFTIAEGAAQFNPSSAPADAVDFAFDLLSDVHVPLPGQSPTEFGSRWNIVYDTQSSWVYFRKAGMGTLVRSMHLDSMDWNCSAKERGGPLSQSVDRRLAGDQSTAFFPLDDQVNRKMINQSLRLFRPNQLPPGLGNVLANYRYTHEKCLNSSL